MWSGRDRTLKYSSAGTVPLKFTLYFSLHLKNFMVKGWPDHRLAVTLIRTEGFCILNSLHWQVLHNHLTILLNYSVLFSMEMLNAALTRTDLERKDQHYFGNFAYTYHMEKAYQIFQNNVIVFRKSLNDLLTSGDS